MVGGDDDQYCFAWPATDSIINANCYKTSKESHAQFLFIKIHAELSYDNIDIEEAEEEKEDHDYLLISKRDSKSNVSRFLVPIDQLGCDVNTWWSNISDILSRIGVSLEHQPFIIRRITICANQLVRDPCNLDRKILPMVVSFGSFTDTQNGRKAGDVSSLKESMRYESEKINGSNATSRKVEVKRRFGFNLLIQDMLRKLVG